jgi:chitin synthase
VLRLTVFLEALIFIIRREFMLVGWMIVYLISCVLQLRNERRLVLTFHNRYPVYSFLLPIYSFWCMDEFGWGNTRLVIGEGTSKKVMINEDEKFDESMIPLKKFSGTSFILVLENQLSHATLQSTKPKLGKLARVIQKRAIALG